MLDRRGSETSAGIHLACTPYLFVVNDKWILAEGHETSKEVFNK